MHPLQFGFRPHHWTESALAVFLEKVRCLLDKNGCVGAVFLDLKRAFDTVNHKVLLSKLTHFNFSARAIKWMELYLSEREQCTMVDRVRSPYLGSPVGVPQGSILGPILFSLYINNLPDIRKDVDVQLYADDTVIFTKAKHPQEAVRILSTTLIHIQNWLIESCLLLNTKKTVCFFSKQLTHIAHMHIFTQELNVEFKYLGVMLDSTLSFRSHIKMVTKTVKFNLYNFRQIRRSLTDSAAMLFLHSMISSHLSYCLTSWSLTATTTLKPIESLHKKALKILGKKPFSYHHCNILSQCSLLSFENFKKFKSVCLMYKVLHGLAPPPLNDFITLRPITTRVTRAVTNRECVVPLRKTSFGQNVLSYKGSTLCNSLPISVRECASLATFKGHLKVWFKANQFCDHA